MQLLNAKSLTIFVHVLDTVSPRSVLAHHPSVGPLELCQLSIRQNAATRSHNFHRSPVKPHVPDTVNAHAFDWEDVFSSSDDRLQRILPWGNTPEGMH
jgi:hypothetical protein